jgi:alpha-1,2-mannosyltransferase
LIATLGTSVLSLVMAATVATGQVGRDLLTWRGALQTWLAGGDIYAYTDDRGLGFTYPPPAAWVLWPVAELPIRAAWLAWTAVTVAALLVATRLFMTHYFPHSSRAVRWAGATGLLALLLTTSQVRSNLVLGQISVLLACATLADAVARPSRTLAGVATGASTAIKFLPALFIPYYFAIGERRKALIAALTTAAISVIGVVLLSTESSKFWRVVLTDTSRIGPMNTTDNQSLRGLLARAGIEGSNQFIGWAVVGSLLVVIALWQARRVSLNGDRFAGAVIMGCVSAIVTPISWPHHQLWLPLAGLILVLRSGWHTKAVGGGIIALCVALPATLSIAARAPSAAQALVVSLPTFALLCATTVGLGQPRPSSTVHT